MVNHSQVESAVLVAVEDALRVFLPQLSEQGLAFQPPFVEVVVSDPSIYTSELRVYFVRANNIVDAIEFHIFDQGQQMVRAIQVADWIKEDVSHVLARTTHDV